MKRISLILALLLCVRSVSAVAGTKQSATINLADPAVISGTQLQPGEYVVRWSGTCPDVQIQFLRDGKPVATVPGKVIAQRNFYDSAVVLRATDNGSKTISEIDFSKVTLQLQPASEVATK
jgi:hypothetical protein